MAPPPPRPHRPRPGPPAAEPPPSEEGRDAAASEPAAPWRRALRRLRRFRVPWFGRTRDGISRKEQRFRLLRDVLGGIAVLGIVLGGLYVASGGAWPPVVVVESGSMMHPESETPYGRIGTIDVGDILFVQAVKDPEHDVHTWADGGAKHYGRPGDVIVYAQDGDFENTSIIHRAMAYVEVKRAPNVSTTYVVHWIDHKQLVFGNEGIYLPELGFSEPFGYTPTDGYHPTYSGFITKGDNAQTNPASDQAAGISDLVDPHWVIGIAHGEIPWMGLAKLALQSGQTNPEVPGWPRVGNAFAPLELWTCFFGAIGVIILIPLSWDTWKIVREQRRRQAEAIAAEEAVRRRQQDVVEFEPLPD